MHLFCTNKLYPSARGIYLCNFVLRSLYLWFTAWQILHFVQRELAQSAQLFNLSPNLPISD